MQTNEMDWTRQRSPEENRADMIEGAKMCGASPESAEAFVHLLVGDVGKTGPVTCLSCGTSRDRTEQCCGH